jgi:hypothetical protein
MHHTGAEWQNEIRTALAADRCALIDVPVGDVLVGAVPHHVLRAPRP